MARRIDRLPPAPTGDPRRDSAAACEYLFYLREQLNFILSVMDRKEETDDGNEA